jgi:hypothetical protein
MKEHLQPNIPPLYSFNVRDYELFRYGVYCSSLDKEMIDLLLSFVKITRLPQCLLCSFYVERQTMDDFQDHTVACSGESVSYGYCHCLIGMRELNDHT